MPENKIPQRSTFGVGADKDFFSGENPIPVKSDIPRKPTKTTELGNIAPPLDSAAPPQLIMPKKDGGGIFDQKITPGKTAKPFETISEGLAPLRTYRQDVAGVMRDKKTSLVRLVLEEQKERNKREREKSPTSSKNLPLIILSLFFLFAAAGMVYYIFFRLNPTDRTLADLKVTPLIFTEKNKEVSTAGKTSSALEGEITNLLHLEELRVDAVEYIFFTETLNSKTTDGEPTQEKNLISTDRFFERLGLKMPPMLLRSLRPNFMLGFHSFNKNQPFLIVKTDYYDNAFAGILDWESKMAGDLLPVFGRADRARELSQRKWDDTVIKNKDTRVLRNFDGSIALIYTFKDQHTLIITTNEDTLLEVSRRLDLVKEERPE
jgi:hypothetical protein